MTMKIGPAANPAWKRFMADRSISAVPRPELSREDRFFLMGSCFAEEIRLALVRELGEVAVVPDYRQVRFDRARAQVDELPGRNHLNTYNAWSVLQEIERILAFGRPRRTTIGQSRAASSAPIAAWYLRTRSRPSMQSALGLTLPCVTALPGHRISSLPSA
jgi:hypothetical protein